MKLFTIKEDDLAALERELPRLLEAGSATLDNSQRAKWRQVRDILTNVRWDYGPPLECIRIDASGPHDERSEA